MRIYSPRRIRDAMRGEYEAGDLFDPRINKEASIDELYSAMGPGYVGGTVHRPDERNYAAENTDHYDSRGSVTPSYTHTVPSYEQRIDYSTLSHASRIEQQAAQEITDAIARARRSRETEVLISDSLQDNLQDTQDQVSQMAQDTERYDWLDDYNAWLNGSENSNVKDAQDVDPSLEGLLDNTEADIHGDDTLDDIQDSEADEEHDAEYLQH